MGRVALAFAVLSLGLRMTLAAEDGLARLPPMGWRSWNCYQGDVSQEKMQRVVDAMVAKRHGGVSLQDLGYANVGLDDGWADCARGRQGDKGFHNPDHSLRINQKRFPDMKQMVDYGHSHGMRMGWYLNLCLCLAWLKPPQSATLALS